MKKLLAALILPLFLTACPRDEAGYDLNRNGQPLLVRTKPETGYAADVYQAVEMCYGGITYVRFSRHTMSWGSVKVDYTGRPVPCDPEPMYRNSRKE